jgi:glycosyltransferase involved in cell wall biosynthesis
VTKKNRKKDGEPISILYDLAYAVGGSGIPGDTRDVALLLQSNPEHRVSFLLSPRTLKSKGRGNVWASDVIGSAVRRNRGVTVLPGFIEKIITGVKSLRPSAGSAISQVAEPLASEILKYLKVLSRTPISEAPSLYVTNLSIPERYARPLKFKAFKLKTKSFQFLIQQHIDPIRVSKDTIHIVRLHDILPIRAPQYFDEFASFVFGRGLHSLLHSRKIVWVMDTNAEAEGFHRYFPEQQKPKVIPCSVGYQFPNIENKMVSERKKQIVCFGTLEPRKRVSIVINGFLRSIETNPLLSEYKLFVVGKHGWQEQALHQQLLDGDFGDNVEYLENCSDFELSELLSESLFVASASAAEGFGLPPLEGMLHGCIPIVSDIPAHRETMGTHGVFFDSTVDGFSEVFENAVLECAKSEGRHLSELAEYVRSRYSAEIIEEQWSKLLESF